MSTVKVLWDADEGVVVIGDRFEAKVESGSDVQTLIEYLRSTGVVVEYTDHDQGTTEVR